MVFHLWRYIHFRKYFALVFARIEFMSISKDLVGKSKLKLKSKNSNMFLNQLNTGAVIFTLSVMFLYVRESSTHFEVTRRSLMSTKKLLSIS